MADAHISKGEVKFWIPWHGMAWMQEAHKTERAPSWLHGLRATEGIRTHTHVVSCSMRARAHCDGDKGEFWFSNVGRDLVLTTLPLDRVVLSASCWLASVWGCVHHIVDLDSQRVAVNHLPLWFPCPSSHPLFRLPRVLIGLPSLTFIGDIEFLVNLARCMASRGGCLPHHSLCALACSPLWIGCVVPLILKQENTKTHLLV